MFQIFQRFANCYSRHARWGPKRAARCKKITSDETSQGQNGTYSKFVRVFYRIFCRIWSQAFPMVPIRRNWKFTCFCTFMRYKRSSQKVTEAKKLQSSTTTERSEMDPFNHSELSRKRLLQKFHLADNGFYLKILWTMLEKSEM